MPPTIILFVLAGLSLALLFTVLPGGSQPAAVSSTVQADYQTSLEQCAKEGNILCIGVE
jgi:hypothetical protein